MAIPSQIAEVQRRLDARHCLRCNFGPLEINNDTGFPEQFCYPCREAMKREDIARRRNAAPGASSSAYRKKHKEEGLDNLDRLTKETP